MQDKLLNYLNKFDDKESVLFFLFVTREKLDWRTNINDEDIYQLIRDGIITRDYVRQEFVLSVPFYNTDDGTININDVPVETIADRIDDYRVLFKGYRIGNMGNRKNCIDLMTRFIIEHNTTLDEIIQATLYYIENSDQNYITNAENFIYRIDERGKQISKLETVLEEYLLSNKESNLL